MLSKQTLIKEVEPWPISVARNDLYSSMALYYYAQYGLEMRERLEIDGPYEFKMNNFEFTNRIGIFRRGEESRESFSKHRTSLMVAASHQLILNAYAVFDFFVANLIIYTYQSCQSINRNPEHGFQFTWSDTCIDDFLHNKEIENIEDDDWIKEHHKYDVVKKRISLIESSLNIRLRDFSIASQSTISNWPQFCDFRRIRHSVAHNAGRKSLYTTNSLEKHEVAKEVLVELETYLSKLLSFINHKLYENEIINYKHKTN